MLILLPEIILTFWLFYIKNVKTKNIRKHRTSTEQMLILWPGFILTFGLFYIKNIRIKSIRKQRTKPDTKNIKKKPMLTFSDFWYFWRLYQPRADIGCSGLGWERLWLRSPCKRCSPSALQWLRRFLHPCMSCIPGSWSRRVPVQRLHTKNLVRTIFQEHLPRPCWTKEGY